MAYTQKQMAAAQARAIEAKKAAGTRGKIGKTGRVTMQIDEEAYFNAIDRNGGVDASGQTIWSDSGFRNDMKKRHPETVVAAEKAGDTIGPYLGPAADNFRAIFGESKFDGVVALSGDPFAHVKIK